MPTKYYYQAEVSHRGLNKYQIVKAASRHELNMKVAALQARWDEQWERKVEREQRLLTEATSIEFAQEMTEDAVSVQEALDSIVLSNLAPEEITLETLINTSKYPEPPPAYPRFLTLPPEPNRSDSKYTCKPSLLTKLSKRKTEEFNAKNTAAFEEDYAAWMAEKDKIKLQNMEISSRYDSALNNWKLSQAEFEAAKAQENLEVTQWYEDFKAGKCDAVEKYYTLLLETINLPIEYDASYEVGYDTTTKRLIVEVYLPTVDDIPNLKSVSYIKSRKEFKETYYSDSYRNKKYDNVIYQIILVLYNYIFSIDETYSLIDTAVINGKIQTVDKATGNNIEPYVLSISSTKEDFKGINLSAVDPKAWFKSARGTSAASIATVTPVAPMITISHEDDRFIDGYSVVGDINAGVNLAAIDWQDFENLVRELFEKEFNVNGGEVKITQASRDGGVDAIAFDPDPIRGGKIVIQAKRYTNVVGVAAVRDLYGTLLHEGATKGVLVTTSNYGNDAYEFAKGKPLTLLNGANLLSLLEKHSIAARIDIKEAKEILRS